MNIYVGNLSWGTSEADLRDAFEAFGDVSSVAIIKDRDTGKSRGFGFVEMPVDAEANAAIEALNGSNMDGRSLTVNEARPREDNRRPRSAGGDRGRRPGSDRGGRSRY